MDQSEKIFESLYIDLTLFQKIRNEFDLSKEKFAEYCADFESKRAAEIIEIRRVRQLYNNKKNELDEFRFSSFKEFYTWHKNQFEIQKGECFYCHTHESTIRTLFDKNIISSVRQLNRGQHLEVERKDGKNKLYNAANCVLACYFCNNDKSDIFSERDYLLYLKDRKSYFVNKLDKMNDL